MKRKIDIKNKKQKIIIIGISLVILILLYVILFGFGNSKISLNTQYIKMYEQEVYQLKASSDRVIWISDNPNVASVTSTGIVTAISEGEARIIVKTEDGKNSNSCVVVVVKKEVESIEFDRQELVIQKGEEANLTVIITPDDLPEKVTWASSNDNIVSVLEDGKIKAIGEGIAIIKAEKLGKEATIPVFVGIKATSIKIEKIEEIALEESIKLNVEVLPEKSLEEKIIWESSDPNILEVDNDGKITAKSIGNASITASTEYSKIKDTYNVTVTKKKYEVKFMELNETIKVKEGEKIGTLKTMSKEEYNFLGWYTEEKDGEKVTEDTIVTSNMILYPHWEVKETYTEGPGQGYYSKTVTYMGRTFKDYKQNRMGAAIEAGGCGPVSLLDIISGYDDNITIDQIIKVTGLSTSFHYINLAANTFGLAHTEVYVYSSNNPNEAGVKNYTKIAIDHLKQGHQLIVLVSRAGCDNGICNGMPYDAYSWGNHFIAIIGVKKDNEHVIIFNPQEVRMEEGRMEDIIRYYLPGGPQSGFVAYWK